MEYDNKRELLLVVSALLLLDNITLTMVVPIIPDFLLAVDGQLNKGNYSSINSAHLDNHVLGPQAYPLDIESENGRVGLLLSSKAILQLLLNPVVGYWIAHKGCSIPLFTGTLILLLSILSGESYPAIFLARAIQGLASSCIGVAGMSLIAGSHREENGRSQAMGFALSSAALGVLIGYPFGGFMYVIAGKTFPFLIIAVIVFALAVIQFYSLDRKDMGDESEEEGSMWPVLLKDRRILLCVGAIWLSTSAMAILEPCLPLWLISQIKPKKWQLGTVFIPDSVGYALGTNVFSQLAYQEGRTRVAVTAMIVVGLSCIAVPLASSMYQLVVPHFLLGLGIGAVDAALVPLLAALADSQKSNDYGTVYAIQQIAVCMAYALGPIFGGEMVAKIGFPWLMTSLGIINFVYCPILATLGSFQDDQNCSEQQVSTLKKNEAGCGAYQTFDEEND